MREVKEYRCAEVNLDYVLRQAVIQMHAVIRVFDKSGYLIRKYGMLDDDKDPVMRDTDFFRLLMGYGWQDCPHLYYEYDQVISAVIQMDLGWVMIIGPVSLVPVYKELNQKIIRCHHLDPADGYRLPYCSREFFVCGLLSVFHMITGQELSVDDVWEKNFMNREMKKRLEQNLVETTIMHQEKETPRTPYNMERREMDCISKGDKEGLRKVISEMDVGERGILAADQLRQAKNRAISLITLASRAAIEGGIAAENALTVSDSFICMAESMKTAEQVEAVMREAEYKLVDMVVEEKQKAELPHPLVTKVKDYVFRNLQSEIKVSDMAGNFCVNADYLSSLFHKSTGKTITRYVLEEKVKAAKSMLIYTSNTLQEIAFVLNFSSQSHFSTVFRKFTGLTPKEYRDTYSLQETDAEE